ncbi:MAG: hypothetical protein RBT47_10650, partial [Anaerolineae bacterium]|nr:hypothetical protein [Anaerolineae bacterium]
MAPLLQKSSWQFDPLSALIGAVAAGVIAFFLYQNRKALQQLAQKLWEPVARMRRKLQSSTEEKYLSALQEALRGLLLFTPQNPQAIFVPPAILAPTPIPAVLAEETPLQGQEPVDFHHLLDGHSRLILTGVQGTGRTISLAMLVWEIAKVTETGQPYQRFPLWIDLTQVQPETPPTIEALANLAVQFFPQAYPKWIITQLQTSPSLILADNWDRVSAESRQAVAAWIGTLAGMLPESAWVAATDVEGYGPLVEAGFMPVTMTPAGGRHAAETLYRGWASLVPPKTVEAEEDALNTLIWAAEANEGLPELTLRTLHYLRTGDYPNRPVEVMEALLQSYLPVPALGEEQAEVAQQAHDLALTTLLQVAKTAFLEGRAFSKQELQEFVTSILPPEEGRPPKLEGELRKLLQNT